MKCFNCNKEVSDDETICPHCGVKFINTSTSTIRIEDAANIIVESKNEYKQYESKRMKKYHLITNLILIACSILMIALEFTPILTFTGKTNPDLVNILSYLNFGKVNYINLAKGLSGNIDFNNLIGNTYLINVNIIRIYIYLSFTLETIMILTNILLLINSLVNIIKKKNYVYYKNLVGTNLVISIILLIVFSFDGIGNILMLIISFLLLIWFFISELLSLEKKFKPKTCFIKGIIIVIFGFLMFSVCINSMYIRDGSNDLVPASLVSTDILSGKPYTQILLQYMAINSFDKEVATPLTLLLGANVIITFVMVFLSVIAFVSLIKSFSNQSIKLPLKSIWISSILMMAFIILNLVFVNLTNEAYYAKALAEYMSDGNILTAEESIALNNAASYFGITTFTKICLLLAIPVSAGSTYARKLILKIKE